MSKEAVRKHYYKKMAVVQQYRAARGCAACGEMDSIVLELHHRPGEVKHRKLAGQNGNSFTKLSWKELAAELDKCDVLCANCHRRVTHAERTS